MYKGVQQNSDIYICATLCAQFAHAQNVEHSPAETLITTQRCLKSKTQQDKKTNKQKNKNNARGTTDPEFRVYN